MGRRSAEWTYMLRIPGRNPERMRVDRMGEYIREFGLILGVENDPCFAGIKRASTGVCAHVPEARREAVWKRVQRAKSKPGSNAAKPFRNIETLLGQDALPSAQLLDRRDNVLFLFQATSQPVVTACTVRQEGEVDGVVIGIQGADDTIHLQIRDHQSRDLRLLVRDVEMARQLLVHFKESVLRFRIAGLWTRTESGWVPEASRCAITSFEVLEEVAPSEVFARLSQLGGNGWGEVGDPASAWRNLRGIH